MAALTLAVAGVVASTVVLLPEDEPDEMAIGPTSPPSVQATPIPPPPTPDPVRNVPEVTLFDVEKGQALALWQTDWFVRQALLSPNGRWLYYVASPPRGDTGTENIYRIDLANPQAPAEHIDRGWGMRISSQGDLAYLAFVGTDDYRPTVLAADGSRHELQPGVGFRAFVWSPDGRWLAYKGTPQDDGDTYPEYLLDTRTWQQRTYAEPKPCQCDGNPVPMWSPDSTRFTYVKLTADGEEPLLFDAATLTSVPSPRNKGWINNQSYIASTREGSALEFFTYNIATGHETQLAGPTYSSPDGGDRR
jgi:Tol biopolymer transport system component